MWRMSRSRSNSFAGPGLHQSAVAQNGDAIGVRKRLFERMRDEDHRDAGLLQRRHQLEQMIRLFRRQRRGRFVQNDDPSVIEHGAGDLDHLAFGGRKRAGQLGRIDVEVETLQHLSRRVSHFADRIERALAPENHVLRHGQLRNQAGFLVHHRNAVARRVFRRRQMHGLSVDDEAPLRGRDDARDQFAQGGLARAVLSDKRMDFAGEQFEIGALERSYAAIELGDAFEANDRTSAHRHFLPGQISKSPRWRG